MILRALHALYPGREQVVIPAYTCYSVPASIRRAGLHARLCDLGPYSLDFDFSELETLIKSGGPFLNTDGSRNLDPGPPLAVMPTHLFGIPANVGGVKDVCAAWDIPVIEDAAQAMGQRDASGKKLGTLGDVGFFSLGRGKAFSAVSGGVIITNHELIGETIRTNVQKMPLPGPMASFEALYKALVLAVFLHPSLYWIPRGLPFLKLGQTVFEPDFPIQGLTPFQAGLSSGWAENLMGSMRVRVDNVQAWAEKVRHDRFLTFVEPGRPLPLLRFPLLCRNSDDAGAILTSPKAGELGIMPGYPRSINRIPDIAPEFAGQDYPRAQACAEALITLPVHQYLTWADQQNILAVLQ